MSLLTADSRVVSHFTLVRRATNRHSESKLILFLGPRLIYMRFMDHTFQNESPRGDSHIKQTAMVTKNFELDP